MKTLEELFIVELKNVYALEKQINKSAENWSDINNEKFSKLVEKIKKRNVSDYEKIQSLLQLNSINPGNTTDSVVNEMLINIESISSSKMQAKVKEAGIAASLNRLISYKTVNYINVERMAKTLKNKKAKKVLKRIRKKSENNQDKLQKLARNTIYKKAV